MVLSASTVVSFRGTGSSYTLFLRQLMFASLGVAAMMFLSRMPVAFFRRIAPLLMIVALIALLLVLVPGIGVEVNGQRNWIGLGGPFRLQPSEFAKF
ncbi:MAG: cell division protein FtsW, partial [Actinomycetes bacterium]